MLTSTDTIIFAGYGTYKIIDHDINITNHQTINSYSINATSLEPCITIKGFLSYIKSSSLLQSVSSLVYNISSVASDPAPSILIPYTMTFTIPTPTQLRFHVHIQDQDCIYNKTFLSFYTPASEAIFGMGEQLTHWSLKGHSIPVMSREDGVGRGAQPATFLANSLFSKDAGGDDVSSYKPVPHFITSHLRALFLENKDYSLFDFKSVDIFRIKVASSIVIGRVYTAENPLKYKMYIFVFILTFILDLLKNLHLTLGACIHSPIGH